MVENIIFALGAAVITVIFFRIFLKFDEPSNYEKHPNRYDPWFALAFGVTVAIAKFHVSSSRFFILVLGFSLSYSLLCYWINENEKFLHVTNKKVLFVVVALVFLVFMMA